MTIRGGSGSLQVRPGVISTPLQLAQHGRGRLKQHRHDNGDRSAKYASSGSQVRWKLLDLRRATSNHRSHAREGDIPGTVDLNAAEGDETGYGQALFPVPAEDPNDPLQVSILSG